MHDSLGILTMLLRQALSCVTHAVDLRLADHSLTLAKAIPLIALLDSDRHTPSSIARLAQCDAGAMTRTIAELEEKGLLTRERSRVDRRVVVLRLTPPGLDMARAVAPVVSEAMEAQVAGLSSPQRATLAGLLKQIGTNAEAGLG